MPRGGWDRFLDNIFQAEAFGFRDEEQLTGFVTDWIDGEPALALANALGGLKSTSNQSRTQF